MIDLFVASIIQGITEFIPVSSSLHLIIYSKFFSAESLSLLMIATMHMGSVLGLSCFFLIDTKPKLGILKNRNFIKSIIISTLPIFIVGIFMYDLIENTGEINSLMVFTTVFFGLALFFSDSLSKSNKSLRNISYRDSLLIGLSQCLSLIPGVSRSASAIILSRILNIDRESSILYSVVLSVPVIIGAFSIAILKVDIDKIIINDIWVDIILSLTFSFLSSYLTLRLFYEFSRVSGFAIFAIYRVLLGLILFLQI